MGLETRWQGWDRVCGQRPVGGEGSPCSRGPHARSSENSLGAAWCESNFWKQFAAQSVECGLRRGGALELGRSRETRRAGAGTRAALPLGQGRDCRVAGSFRFPAETSAVWTPRRSRGRGGRPGGLGGSGAGALRGWRSFGKHSARPSSVSSAPFLL